MPLDPQLAALLPPPAAQPTLSAAMLPDMRAQMRGTGAGFPRPEDIAAEEHRAGAIPLRLYRPADAAGDALLVFLHGGGWILGDLDTHEAMAAWIAAVSGLAVLAVDYRLAPEHRFPAGLEDCDAAFAWAVEHAAALGFDPARVAIGGESAGANLAAAVAIRRRDRGEAQPMFQCLVHPATDLRLGTPSLDGVEGPGPDRAFMEAVRDLYLRDPADRTDPGASPMLAASHTGLAPAIVLTAECDPLRDDGEAYALALAAAGVETVVQRLPGLPHGFLFLPFAIEPVARAYRLLGALLRRYVAVA